MKPYVKPAMLECRRHPTTGLWCREDGAVLMPECRKYPTQRFTFGWMDKKGYMRVTYRGKPYLVHRLVAQTFLSNPDNLPTVDHINRIKTDNRAFENLRFASYKTQADNQQRVDDCIAKYGVRPCMDRNAHSRIYMLARYAADPEHERARKRKEYAADPEHKLAMTREWMAKQKALGRRCRKCTDGKHHWLTDSEYDDRFGNEPRQMQLF